MRSAWLGLCLIVVACGSTGQPPSDRKADAATGGSPSDDAGPGDDAGADAGQPDAGLTLDAARLTADGADAVHLSLVLRGADGAPLAGKPVQFSVLGSRDELEAREGVTDATGTFTTALTSTFAEKKVVVAYGGSSRFSGDVEFLTGAPDKSVSSFTASGARLGSDGVSAAQLRLSLADKKGNAIKGSPVSLSVSGAGALSATAGQTDVEGLFTSSLTSSAAGDATVTALAAGLTFTLQVSFAPGAPSAAHSSLSIAQGAPGAGTATVTLADTAGNPVAGAPVTLSSDGAGDQITGGAGVTAADGTFVATLSAPYAEKRTVTANAGGLVLEAPWTVAGSGWQFAHHGIFGGLVHAVAFDPSNPVVAWAGAPGGVFRSGDRGATWTPTSGSFYDWVDCLIVDPATSDVFACSGGGWVTRDAGAHWSYVLSGDVVTGMAMSQGVLYASEFNSGISVSTDGGRSFDPLPSSPAVAVKGVLADPANKDHLYTWSTTLGIFSSIDGGKTWSHAAGNGIDPAWLYALALDPADPSRLWAVDDSKGVCVSTDSGATWQVSYRTPQSMEVQPFVQVSPWDSATVFASINDEILRSTDRGATWTKISVLDTLGTPIVIPTTIAFDPADHSRILAGGIAATQIGVFESPDLGSTWSFSSDGIELGVIEAFAADPFKRGRALASVNGTLVRTEDAGGHWRRSDQNMPVRSVLGLLADPQERGTYYAAMWNDSVWKSTDFGATWNRSIRADIDFTPQSMTLVRTTPTTVFAASQDTNRVYATNDGGGTWSLFPVPKGVITVAGCDAHPQTLYAGGSGGVFRTTDFGGHWTQVRPALSNANDFIQSILVDPADDAVAFVSTYQEGLLRTLDGGQTWTDVSSAVCPPYAVRGVLLDPLHPSTLYAAMANQVWKTTDRGGHWALRSGGIPSGASVEQLFLSPVDPLLLYATTFVSGIYRTAAGAE